MFVANKDSIVPLSHSLEITSAVKSIPIKFIVIAKDPGKIKRCELISWLYQYLVSVEIKSFEVLYLKSDEFISQLFTISLQYAET